VNDDDDGCDGGGGISSSDAIHEFLGRSSSIELFVTNEVG